MNSILDTTAESSVQNTILAKYSVRNRAFCPHCLWESRTYPAMLITRTLKVALSKEDEDAYREEIRDHSRENVTCSCPIPHTQHTT